MKYASRLAWLGCLAWMTQGTPAQAQQHQSGAGEALQLLQKVATAAHKVTYSGVFVYQSGSRGETSRITHLIDGGNEFERLEVLDGSPREVMRRNDEVRCFFGRHVHASRDLRTFGRDLHPFELGFCPDQPHEWII